MRNNKGFTLIELVVVIVILGILMLLIIPRVREFQDNAEVRTCQGNQRTLGSAQAMYYAQYTTTAANAADLAQFTGAISYPRAGCSYVTAASDPYIWTCNNNSNGKSHKQPAAS